MARRRQIRGDQRMARMAARADTANTHYVNRMNQRAADFDSGRGNYVVGRANLLGDTTGQYADRRQNYANQAAMRQNMTDSGAGEYYTGLGNYYAGRSTGEVARTEADAKRYVADADFAGKAMQADATMYGHDVTRENNYLTNDVERQRAALEAIRVGRAGQQIAPRTYLSESGEVQYFAPPKPTVLDAGRQGEYGYSPGQIAVDPETGRQIASGDQDIEMTLYQEAVRKAGDGADQAKVDRIFDEMMRNFQGR